jgi:hypothetical protein
MFFHLGYQDACNGRVGVEMDCTTFKGILSQSKWDMIVLDPNGPTKNMAIEISNLSPRHFKRHFKWKGFEFEPHLQIAQKVLIDP